MERISVLTMQSVGSRRIVRHKTLHFLRSLFAVFEGAPGKNKRHKKEVAGLVSGVESGVSKERLG